MKELRFSLPIVPPTTTAQQKGVFVTPTGKALFYEKANVKVARKLFMACLAPFRPPVPMQGPLQVSIEMHFPFRASEKRSVVNAAMPVPHYVRPDIDNMAKLPLDCMTKLGFWEDDGQISWLQARKLWSARPRIDVYVFAMSEWAGEDGR
jgi:Holliday junction resolvase RusA-like endonuclease